MESIPLMDWRPKMNPSRLMCVPAMMVMLAGGAWADDGVLSGPKVEPTEGTGDSLVQRDLMGEMEMVEGMPELLAIDLVELTAAQRMKVDQVLAERASVVDRLSFEHVGLVEELRAGRNGGGDARGGEEGARMRGREGRMARIEQMREVVAAFRPMFERGPLMEEVRAALPEDQRDAYEGLVREYRDAAMGQRLEESGREMPTDRPERREPSPERVQRLTRMLEERLGDDAALVAQMATDPAMMQSFLHEVMYSYRKVADAGLAHRDRFLQELNVTPEQEAMLTNLFMQLREAAPEDRREMIREAMQSLDQEQRRKLMEYFRGNRTGRARANDDE